MEMQMEWPYVFAVVITGLVVVFAALILLIIFISALGKLFEASANKKKSKELAEIKPEPVKAVSQPSAPQPEEIAEETDDDEIIAVISAAVAMMAASENKTYRIKSVKAVKNGSSRNAWAMAGIRENTNPF